MKTIGLIGGISPFSTATYYQTINQLMNTRLGGHRSAKILLYSLDFHAYRMFQDAEDWQGMENMLGSIAKTLEQAGADCLLICSNTPHIIADSLRRNIHIPLLHIAEETAKEIDKEKVKKVGLLGTASTMEHPFFIGRLADAGIGTLVPEAKDREMIHSCIIHELTKGIFSETRKQQFLHVMNSLQQQGAEAIIFGCTEISLLLPLSECPMKIFDTTSIHSQAAVDFALSA